MLPKKLRLSSRDIKTVLTAGFKYSSPFFTLRFLPQNNIKHSVWLVRVYKKNHPLAVDRNRAKRLVRAAVLLISPTLKPPGKAILISRRPLKNMNLTKITQEITALFKKSRAL